MNSSSSIANSAPEEPRRPPASDVVLLVRVLVGLALLYGGVAAYRAVNRPPTNETRELAASGRTAPPARIQVQYVRPEAYVERPVVVAGQGAVVLPATLRESPESPAAEDSPYVAAETCAECHAERFRECAETAHFRSLRVADETIVRGSFRPGENVLETGAKSLRFEMLREPDGLYQKVVVDVENDRFEWRQRIDLVSGSGRLGQTYLSWLGDQLFQLPVSYFTEQGCWTNSPGYLDGVADFARPAIPRCLECHATYARSLPGANNRYERSSLIPGVTCQRCHGPGREHVAYHREHPDAAEPRAIVNPRDLPRERQLEVCEQCHSGKSTLRGPAFSYRPGDLLDEHLAISPEGREVQGRVHTANQSARIKLSRCFQASGTLTCMTCHDPHRDERGDLATFSRRCATCHAADACREAPRRPGNCIDCHMPTGRETNSGITRGGGAAVNPTLRDHWIKVWSDSPRASP